MSTRNNILGLIFLAAVLAFAIFAVKRLRSSYETRKHRGAAREKQAGSKAVAAKAFCRGSGTIPCNTVLGSAGFCSTFSQWKGAGIGSGSGRSGSQLEARTIPGSEERGAGNSRSSL